MANATPRPVSALALLSGSAAGTLLLIGGLGVLGWVLDIDVLTRWCAGWMGLEALAFLAIILAGVLFGLLGVQITMPQVRGYLAPKGLFGMGTLLTVMPVFGVASGMVGEVVAFGQEVSSEDVSRSDRTLLSMVLSFVGLGLVLFLLANGLWIHSSEQTEQKEPESVARSEARFRALIEHSYDGLVLVDAQGTVLYVSPTCEKNTGYSAAESLGKSVFMFSVSEDLARVREKFQEMLRTPGGSVCSEGRYYHRDGRLRWAESILTNQLENPEIRAVVIHCRDVTERKEIEQERDRILGELGLQIERMPLAYLRIDAELRYTEWNPAAERLFGYTREEVLGKSPFDVIVPEESRGLVERIFDRLQSGDMNAHGSCENVTREGRRIYCEWHNTPLFGPEGKFEGILSLAQDISARRSVEQTLLLRDRAMSAVTQGIVITDAQKPDQPIIYVSPGFEKITGYEEEEVLGRNCRFLQGKQTAPGPVEELRRAIREGRGCSVELLNYTKQGTPFWNALSISPIQDAHGRITHYVGVQSDVTERRKLEEHYLQAQKMEAVGRLAGGVAHDFNNLLTIINGHGEILLSSLPVEDPIREMVEEMTKAGTRAASLTRQLLAFTRQQVIAPRLLDLNAVVADMEKMLRRLIGEDVLLRTVLPDRLGMIRADPGQIEQVLLNLVVNSRDAMPQGGKLTIETSTVKLDETYGRTHPGVIPGNYVLLAVTDTGVGMTVEVRERIFQPFFTTKPPGKGTGLGLATVFGIVQQASGHVDVYSEVGVGTCFKIYFPCVEEERPAGMGLSSQGTAPRGSETLLVVEDEDAVRLLIRTVLEQNGYRILEASGGAEAMELAKQHPNSIQLIVTDVVMPEMGGRQLVEALRRMHPKAKVLYLSGYTDDAVVRHGVLHDTANFLQKPFATLALARKVREVLDGGT